MECIAFSSNSCEELTTYLSSNFEENLTYNLAIVFCSPAINFDKTLAILNKYKLDVFGCSSSGEIINSELNEFSISVLLLKIDRSFYKILNYNLEVTNEAETAQKLALEAEAVFSNRSVLFLASGLKSDAGKFVEEFVNTVSNETEIYGGLAGDDAKFEKTHCFTNDFISENGCVALVFDSEKLEINGRAITGWTGIGKKFTLTKTSANVIYEINDQPALDVFIDNFNLDKNVNVTGKKPIASPGQYPLEIIDKAGFKKLRSIMAYNKEDKSLVLAGSVFEGMQFRFCNSPTFDEVDKTVDAYKEFANNYKELDALILISCVCRHMAFGPVMEDEVEGIQNHWEIPLIGFFSYGEIAKIDKFAKCDLHNATASLITLKEK